MATKDDKNQTLEEAKSLTRIHRGEESFQNNSKYYLKTFWYPKLNDIVFAY